MAPKSKKKAVLKKKPKMSKEIAFLHKLVSLSLKAADSPYEGIRSIFIDQAHRLLDQIEKLKEKQ